MPPSSEEMNLFMAHLREGLGVHRSRRAGPSCPGFVLMSVRTTASASSHAAFGLIGIAPAKIPSARRSLAHHLKRVGRSGSRRGVVEHFDPARGKIPR